MLYRCPSPNSHEFTSSLSRSQSHCNEQDLVLGLLVLYFLYHASRRELPYYRSAFMLLFFQHNHHFLVSLWQNLVSGFLFFWFLVHKYNYGKSLLIFSGTWNKSHQASSIISSQKTSLSKKFDDQVLRDYRLYFVGFVFFKLYPNIFGFSLDTLH